MNDIIDIYKDLFDEPNIMGVLCKYIALSEFGIQYNFGYSTLRRGTKLYRIRKYSETTDFSAPKEWEPPVAKLQNRCNAAGECALYLGSDEYVCIMETHININEKYVLGEYEIINDIKVGGYTNVNPNESIWKARAGMLFNSFLIAPSRNEANVKLFELLATHFHDTDFMDIPWSVFASAEDIFELPWRIGNINRGKKYYQITNKMCAVLQQSSPKGIRYSSCFFPMETIGIACSAYNICLYESALKDTRFLRYTVKTNCEKYTPEDVARVILSDMK